MRASEFINEVLDITGPAPETNWHTSKDNGVSIGKWVDTTGKEVKTIFQPNGKGGAMVDFSRDQVAAKDKNIVAGGGRPSYGITGNSDGAASKILTGVSQNLKNYLDTNPNIHTLYFTSLDPSRTKAYSRMIDRLAPEAGLVGTRTDHGSNNTEFVLSRAQPGQRHVPLATSKAPAPTSKPAPSTPTVAAPAAPTKLPLPQGRAIPLPMVRKAFTPSPSLAGSHGNSPNAQAFQDFQDFMKNKMPRI